MVRKMDKNFLIALLMVAVSATVAVAAGPSIGGSVQAPVVNSFAAYSTSTGKGSAASAHDTMYWQGATFSKPGGKPTMTVSGDSSKVSQSAFNNFSTAKAAERAADQVAVAATIQVIKTPCDGVSDDTLNVISAVQSAKIGSTVSFPSNGICIVGALGTLPNAFTLDLNGSTVKIKTDSDWFVTSMVAAGINYQDPPYTVKNGVITGYPGYTPTNVIHVAGGQPDTRIEGITFTNISTTHAIVWNQSGYGTTISKSNFKHNSGPNLTYWSNDYGDYTQYTFKGAIEDTDFSNNNSRAVGIEGGTLSISGGVIESCSSGGIEHTGTSDLLSLDVDDVHFEDNSIFNLKFPPTGVNSVYSKANIHNSQFYNNLSGQTLLLGMDTRLKFDGNYVSSACIDNADPANPNIGTIYASGNNVDGGLDACNVSYGYLITTAMGTPNGKIDAGQINSFRSDNGGTTSHIIENGNSGGFETLYMTEDGNTSNYSFMRRYNTLGASSASPTMRNALVFQTHAQLPCTTTGCGDIDFYPYSGITRFIGLLNLSSVSTINCESSTVGSLNYVAGTGGVADVWQACEKNSDGSYSWAPVGAVLGGNVGGIPYQSGVSSTMILAGNATATDKVIVSHGTGSSAQAPTLSNSPALSAVNMTNLAPSLSWFSIYGQAQATTNYANNIYASTLESRISSPISVSRHVANLTCSVNAAPASGQTITYTLRTGPVGGIGSSALTCVIDSSHTTCADTTHTVALTAGQVWDLMAATSSTSGTMYWTCELQHLP